MKNYVQTGNLIDVVAPPGGVQSGLAYFHEDLFGVPVTDAKEGETVTLALAGVFRLPKLPGDIKQGQKVYWKGGVTTAIEGARLIGLATTAAKAGATEIEVRLGSHV